MNEHLKLGLATLVIGGLLLLPLTYAAIWLCNQFPKGLFFWGMAYGFLAGPVSKLAATIAKECVDE